MTILPSLVAAGAVPLCHNLAGVLVQSSGLRECFDGLLDLRIGFEKHFEAFLSPVG